MTDPSLPTATGVVDRLRQLAITGWRSSLVQGAGRLGAAEVVRLLAGLVQAVLVARWLGPRNYGLAALILTYPSLVFTFFDPQASEAVVKYFGAAVATEDRDRARAIPKMAYLVDVTLAVVGLAVVVATAPLAADHLLKSGADASLIVVAAVGVALAAPGDTSQALLTTTGRFSTVALVQSGTAVARVALVLGLVAADAGVAGMVWGTTLGLIADSLLMAMFAHGAVRSASGGSWFRGRREVIRPELREMTRFLVYTDLTSLASVFVKQADLVILGFVRGPTETGWYRLAQSLTAPFASVITALQTVAYPGFARLDGLRDHAAVARAAKRYLLKVGLPLAALTMCSLAVLPAVIRLVAGSEFASAAGPARWMVAATAVVIAGFWVRPAMFATGQVRFVFGISAITSALTVLGFVILADPYGAAGVAAARALIAGLVGTGVAALRFRQLARSGRLGATEARQPG
jgi:O-antigen/teichoic acid export membrane protein